MKKSTVNMWIKKSILVIVFSWFISVGFSQDASCTLTLRGRITDSDTGLPLSGVTVKAFPGPIQVISDAHGYFLLERLCGDVRYEITASSVGFDSVTVEASPGAGTMLDIVLAHGTVKLHDVEVVGHGRRTVTANPVTTLSKEAIAEGRGSTLAELFDVLPGVSMLQTGSTISKPVINGMHSNRILVLNNGIRQEGQQWGSEHAPEIDPFAAGDFKLIKGAEGVRYGADAIGGVILASPSPMPIDPHLSGELHALYNTNGRSGALSGMMQSAIERIKGLSWRVQGTAKRGGNTRTADYYLGNTAMNEANISAALQYTRDNVLLETYYSRFQTSLGILASAHAGSVEDIEARIAAGRPFEDYPFSYHIGAPRQRVVHDLGKLRWHRDYANGSWMDIQYGIQRNHRQEYDLRRGDRDALPMLDMVLTTQTLDAGYHTGRTGGWESQLGTNLALQVNNNVPGTLNTPLIPNYDSFSAGVFAIERLMREKGEVEAGLRYDFKTFDAAGFNSNQEYYGDYRQFHNISGSLGGALRPGKGWQIRSNVGLAWRAPSANELYSGGLHHGAALYEIGDPDLKSEQSFKWIVNPSYTNDRLTVNLDAYAQYIRNYIYAQPSAGEFIQSIRGTFPVFRYGQTNASFWGMDLDVQYRLPLGFSYQLGASLIRAKDIKQDGYLPYIPADRIDHHLRWEIPFRPGRFSNGYLKLGHRAVSRQVRYEQDSDYAPPPAAYQLFSFHGGTRLTLAHRELDITLSATNLFNTRYREYMNRFRYFSHDMGRNVSLRLAYLF